MLALIIPFLVSIIICFILCLPLLWVMKTFKIGQIIRLEGPQAHYKKAGTPTMGGLAIAIALLGLSLILLDLSPHLFALLFLLTGYSLIGLTDDLLKIIRGQNLGMTVVQKFSVQIFVALIFAVFLFFNGYQNGLFYLAFMVFIIVGAANATNLTDGLDGLLAGCLIPSFLAYGIIAAKLQVLDLSIFCMVAIGACLAFLFFNFNPAKIFMGDVGSLGLGAALAGVAILLHRELLLIIIGGVFVAEALSVILQISSYKLYKRKIFKMSPLHHHFELLGWSEKRVVFTFWIAAVVLAIIGVICT